MRRSSRRSGAFSRLFDSRKTSAWLLACAVGTSALALGGIPIPALLAVSGLVLLALVACLLTGGVSRSVPAPAWVMVALGLYSLLQAVPLPWGLLDRIASSNAEVWQGALTLHQTEWRAAPISLDPGASYVEALKWLTYAAGFSTAALLGRGRAEAGATIVFSSAVLTAFVTLAHRLSDAQSVYGMYQPLGEFKRSSLGPLLNPNNLAGYMNLAFFGALGLMLMRRPPLPHWLLALGAALLLGTVAEASSRGGFLAMGGGLLLLAPFLWRRHIARIDSARARRAALLSMCGVIGLGVLLALLAIVPHAFRRVDDEGFGKLAMASWVLPLVRDYPLLGVGRGAFESVFQSYRIGQNNLIFSHPENFVIQWAAEWGVPVCVLALLAFAWLLRPKALGVRDSAVALGVFTGLLVLLAQNVVDLGLELPALALAASVSVGSCWGSVKKSSRWRGSRRLAGAGVLGLVLFGVLALVLFAKVEPVAVARFRLEQTLAATDMTQPASRAALRTELRKAALAHPADPYFSRLGAVVALRANDQNPLPWLDRALEQGLMNGRTHLLLARALELWGKTEQALLELRFAATYDPQLTSSVAQSALRMTQAPEVLARAAPRGAAGARVLVSMSRAASETERPLLALQLLREAARRAPNDTDVINQLAQLELAQLAANNPSGLCAGAERQRCIDEVGAAAKTLLRVAPTSGAGSEIGGRLRLLLRDPAGAAALLRESCPKVEHARKCQLLLIEATVLMGDPQAAVVLGRSLLAEGCRDMSDCGQIHASVAEVFLRNRQEELALNYLKQAAHEDPSDARWLRVAKLAATLGQHGLAAEAYGKVQRYRGRGDSGLQRRIEAEKLRAIVPEAANVGAGGAR